MPFPPVRCYRSLSWYLPRRLFPFGQLLCLFISSFNSETACFAHCQCTRLASAGYFLLLAEQKNTTLHESLHCANFFIQFANKNSHAVFVYARLRAAWLRYDFCFAMPTPIFMLAQKSTLCDLGYISHIGHASRQHSRTSFTSFISFIGERLHHERNEILHSSWALHS